MTRENLYKGGNSMKALRCVVRILVIAAVAVSVAACGSPVAHQQQMTYDELQARMDEATSTGGFSFTLDQLTSDAQQQYLASIGRAHQSPDLYAGVTISFETGHVAGRGSGNSICTYARTKVGDSYWCRRPWYISNKVSVSSARCRHPGYVSSNAYVKTTTCRKLNCVYLSRTEVYYHRPN